MFTPFAFVKSSVKSSVSPYIVATGGTVTTSGSFKIHTFTSSADFVVTELGTNPFVETLVVAGGGGGATGAGGAGGLIYSSSFGISATTFPIVIGNGGNGVVASTTPGASRGQNGQNTTFSTLTTVGGGGGGNTGDSGNGTGASGGSGGGAGAFASSIISGGTGTGGQGNNGGSNGSTSPNFPSGGGGGAGAVGENGKTTAPARGGNGGDGLQYDFTGTPTYYAGGGGGAMYIDNQPGTGGLGGGGNGATTGDGFNGTANTGGGGGGARGGFTGGSGGSGIVIIKYQYQSPADTYIAAVLAAGGTLSGAQETAIQTFYNSLDTAGIYSKLYAMYPFLGGVAASNAIDFVNPGGGFDLTFTGTWTHSNAIGSSCAANLANYANTSFNPTTDAASVTTNFSFGVFAVAGSNTGYHGIGTTSANYIILGDFAGVDVIFGSSAPFAGAQGYSVNAFVVTSRSGASSWFATYTDSVQSGTFVTPLTRTSTYTPYNADIWLGRINGLANFPGGGQLRFAFIGETLDIIELQALSNAMNTLQTAFSRNSWI